MAKRLKHFWHHYNYIIVFLGIFLTFLIINGSQTTWMSVTNILLHSAILGTIALGMGLVVLTGDIDLSVGSSFVFVGGLTILFYNKTGSILLTVLCAIILGAVCGFCKWCTCRKGEDAAFYCNIGNYAYFQICFTVHDE